MSFRLRTYRATWGHIQEAFGNDKMTDFLPWVASQGYSGIEMPVKVALDYGSRDFRALMDQNKLEYVAMVFTDGPMAPGFDGAHNHHPAPARHVGRHLEVFAAQVQDAIDLLGAARINSHTGNDFMKQDEAFFLFEGCLTVERDHALQHNIVITHETHRKRYLYSPWVCRDFVPTFGSDLKLCADLSHFTCVAETSPSDPELCRVIKALTPNFHHIHGRIGYDHGPQVNDPRAEEWSDYVDGFQHWWMDIFEEARARDREITFTTEHGPPTYQQTIPRTMEPLADIKEVNSWIAQRVKSQFGVRFGPELID